MSFQQNFNFQDATILFWRFDEDDDLNHAELIQPEDLQKVANYHPKKLAEYLMIRKLLKMELPDHKILYKTIGQPYLEPSDFFVSITHSFPWAALAISKKRVGIDLEKVVPKIIRIKNKFLHESELSWTENDDEAKFLTVIWAVKEALYKLHPSKYWSLKKHYRVEPFSLDDLENIKCFVFDDDFEDCYSAKVIAVDDYYFAIIKEDHTLNYNIKTKISP